MKAENWIVAFGAGVLFTAIVAALLPDDLWDDDLHYSSHAIGNTLGAAQGNMFPGQQAPGYPMMAQPPRYAQPPAYAQQPRGQSVAMPAGRGLVPFTAARTEPFAGTVAKVQGSGTDQGWGQIHVWISQPNGGSRELSMAPDWYLEYMGCAVTSNMFVEGSGFIFSNQNTSSSLLYAKEVTVNGVKCRLRNDEGFALWSNRLR